MAIRSSDQAVLGFGLQPAQGSFVEPDTWIALMQTGEPIELMARYAPINLAGREAYEDRYFSVGEAVQTALRFALAPDIMANLLLWILDRDSYNQGKWASVIIDCVHEVKKLTDVKIGLASFELTRGEPVMCRLDVAALNVDVGAGVAPTPDIPTAAPYIFEGARITLANASEGVSERLSEGLNCEMLHILLDPMFEDSSAPLRLVNAGAVRCYGAFSREFMDNVVYADFASGVGAALTIRLRRDTIVAEVEFPRIVYVDNEMMFSNSYQCRTPDQVSFLGLGGSECVNLRRITLEES